MENLDDMNNCDNDSLTPLDTAHYVKEMLESMANLTRNSNLHLLTYLIEVAALQAEADYEECTK
jgi:hypothetical protein